MTADMQVLCHDYASIVLRPYHYRGSRLDMWESLDEIRIRLHREMCAAFDCDSDIVADALDKAAHIFGVDPFNDPYFDINAVSDKFVEAMVAAKEKAGQFEQAEITIHELNVVKATVKKYLQGLYHERIEYTQREESNN